MGKCAEVLGGWTGLATRVPGQSVCYDIYEGRLFNLVDVDGQDSSRDII